MRPRRTSKSCAANALHPQFGRMHPDMTITGNEAVCAGTPTAEYRFFAVHQHNGKICGKAWHHEDRFDPGDMSKCFVRLSIIDNRLQFEIKMLEDSLDPADPDLNPSPPIDLESAAKCDAEKPVPGDSSRWSTFIFTRRP